MITTTQTHAIYRELLQELRITFEIIKNISDPGTIWYHKEQLAKTKKFLCKFQNCYEDLEKQNKKLLNISTKTNIKQLIKYLSNIKAETLWILDIRSIIRKLDNKTNVSTIIGVLESETKICINPSSMIKCLYIESNKQCAFFYFSLLDLYL